MGFGDFVKSQFIDVIEYVDESSKLLVYKWERYKDEIKQGASLIVREGQCAVFVHKGQIADVLYPGSYSLDTHNLPVLSSLSALPRLFNYPIKSDLYFINTTQFLDNRWGTKNPIMMRDDDFGVVRITAFGTYSFRVTGAYAFMREVFGARKLNMTYDIISYLNSFVGEAIAEAISELKIPVLDIASDYRKLAALIKEKVQLKAQPLGIEIVETTIENISLPPEVEKMIDEQSGIGLASKDMSTFMQYQTARAMRDASKQHGGLAGLGAGMAFGNQIAKAVNDVVPEVSPTEKLREYKKLLDEEIITQEEFDSLKKKLLKI